MKLRRRLTVCYIYFYRINSKVSEYLSSVEIQNNTEQKIVGIEEHHPPLHLKNVVNIHINGDLRADVGGVEAKG